MVVKGKLDVDFVVFLVNFCIMLNLWDNLKDILVWMKVYFGIYGGCDVEGIILYVVKVFVICYGYFYSVDILLSVDILRYGMLKFKYLYVNIYV